MAGKTIEEFKSVQDKTHVKIKKIGEDAHSLLASRYGNYSPLLEKLEKLWTRFARVHNDALLASTDEQAIQDYVKNCYEPAAESYRVIKEFLLSSIAKPAEKEGGSGASSTDDDDQSIPESSVNTEKPVSRAEFVSGIGEIREMLANLILQRAQGGSEKPEGSGTGQEKPIQPPTGLSTQDLGAYLVGRQIKDEAKEIYDKTPNFSGNNFRPFWSKMQSYFLANPNMSKTDKLNRIMAKIDPKFKKMDWARSLLPTNEAYDKVVSRMQDDYNNPRTLLLEEVNRFLRKNEKEQDKKDFEKLSAADKMDANVQRNEEVYTSIRAIVAEQLFADISIEVRESEAFMEEHEAQIGNAAFKALFTGDLINCCDGTTRTLMNQAMSIAPEKIPVYKAQADFMRNRCKDLKAGETACETTGGQGSQETKPKATAKVHHAGSEKGKNCLHCKKQNHQAPDCRSFKALGIGERWESVKKNNMCQNCLSSIKDQCKCFKKTPRVPNCKRCTSMHNEMLHRDPKQQDSSGKTAVVNAALVESDDEKQAILSTVVLNVRSASGQRVPLRALLDSGSSESFISVNAVQLLGLAKDTKELYVYGVGGITGPDTKGQVFLNAKALKGDFEMDFPAFILKKVTGRIPNQGIEDIKKPKGGFLADPHFMRPGKIDILLSVRLFPKILKPKADNICLSQSLVWLDTNLGFALFGEQPGTGRCFNALLVKPEVNTDGLEKFFDYDREELKKDDDICDEFYKENTVRRPDGAYCMRIPTKPDMELGESIPRARARYEQMEQSLERNPEKKKCFHAYMEKQIRNGHLALADPNKPTKCCLPIQLVENKKSLTTPVRPTVDASALTSNKRSWNDIQMTGPQRQPKLSSQIIKGMMKEFVIQSDISNMFLCMWVHEDDVDYHRVFYRKSPDEPLLLYVWLKVPFGIKSASHLACATLSRLADDEEHNFPIGAKLLRNNFYVDDLTASFDTAEEAMEAIRQLRGITKAGGFQLKKWSSNHPSILREIPKEDLLEGMEIQWVEKQEDTAVEKILGVAFDPKEDAFFYKVAIENLQSPTKRCACSKCAKMFDPLGFLTPVMIEGRMLVQSMWDLGKTMQDWDKPLPKELAQDFRTWYESLKSLEELKISRWLRVGKGKGMLVGYSDASSRAYGAMVYHRTVDDSGKIHVKLVRAIGKVVPHDQSKIAPADKPDLTMPRLELWSALLLAELMAEVKSALELEADYPTRAYSDSRIVLAWLEKDPAQLKTYEGARTAKILERIPKEQWDYVNTTENPADIISRGIHADSLAKCELYWNGPDALHDSDFLKKPFPTQKFETTVQVRKPKAMVLLSVPEENAFAKFSSFAKKKRVAAWCKRFSDECKNAVAQKRSKSRVLKTVSVKDLTLTAQEVNHAELQIIKYEQAQAYAYELACLSKNKPVKRGFLKGLNIFLDKFGVLRNRGRKLHASIPESEKNPIILPKFIVPTDETLVDEELASHLTAQVIRRYHEAVLHGGAPTTLAAINRRFQIPNGKSTVKYVLHRCVKCRREKVIFYKQLMGDLPQECVTPSPAFEHTAVDYLGPITLKASGLRGCRTYKAWIAVFVCMYTGAYHLEIVTGLDARAFVDCFKKFVARRNLPKSMRSDNAGCFVKGKKILDSERAERILAHQSLVEGTKKMQAFAANHNVEWIFAPARSPHFNGRAEAAVKSVKRHLRKSLLTTELSYEQMNSALIQVEGQVNSRPLGAGADLVLTPGHFLTLRPLNQAPEPDYLQCNLTRKWQHVQRLVQSFWKSWSREIWHQAKTRPKWLHKEPNIQVGDVVLVHEDDRPSMEWPLARVTEVHPGRDGLVRVATVEDARKHSFTRSVTKLAKLPIATHAFPGEDSTTVEDASVIDVPKVDDKKAFDGEKKVVKPAAVVKGKSPSKRKASAKVEEVSTKTENKPRKSARLAAKKPKVPLLALAMMCVCFCFGATEVSAETQVFNNSGVFFVHTKDVLVQSGVLHAKIETNLNIARDLGTIDKTIKSFWEGCNNSNGNALRYCKDNAKALSDWAIVVKAEINARSITESSGRVKRFDGLVPWAWEKLSALLFGDTESHDLQGLSARRTSGIIAHGMESMQNVQSQIIMRQDRLSKEVDYVKRIVKDERFNYNRIEIQMIRVEQQAMENLMVLLQAYRSLDDVVTLAGEFDAIKNNLQPKVPVGSKFPTKKSIELMKLSSATVTEEDGDVTVWIEIPIVYEDMVEELFYVPLPWDGHILKTPPGRLLVDRRRRLFTYKIEHLTRTPVNHDVDMVEGTVHWRQAEAVHDCVANKIMKTFHEMECEVGKLPADYDVWIETPVRNLVVFYTTSPPAQLACPEGVSNVKGSMGIIQIPRGCGLRTKNDAFFATNDMHAKGRNYFMLGHNFSQDIERFTREREPALNFTKLPLIKDDELLEVIEELKQRAATAPWEGWKLVAIFSIGTMISILMIGIPIGIGLEKRRNTGVPKAERTSEDAPTNVAVQAQDNVSVFRAKF